MISSVTHHRRNWQNCSWEKPEVNNYKINFDGSRDGSQRAGAEYCIRDGVGKIIAAEAINYGRSSIIVAVARGLREGVKAAGLA